MFQLNDKIKFRFGNQGLFIYGTITKLGSLISEVISDAGLFYTIWNKKLIKDDLRQTFANMLSANGSGEFSINGSDEWGNNANKDGQ